MRHRTLPDGGTERRVARPGLVEVRNVGEGGGPVIAGYATVYDTPYEIAGGPPYGWVEIIGKGAAAKSAREAGGRDEEQDVKLFFDHDGLPLASARGGTLKLTSDSRGLFSEGSISLGSPYSLEIVDRIQRGDLDSMSFAFRVLRERWEDEDGEEADPMTAPVRRILEVKLFDVSVVSFPANPATAVGMKSREHSGMSLAEARELLDALRR